LRAQVLVASGDVDPAHGVRRVARQRLVLLAVAHAAWAGAVVIHGQPFRIVLHRIVFIALRACRLAGARAWAWRAHCPDSS
ncbi:hypothetical protein RZS08_48355, partial [Arthrospira platensis SPKY1]|nr:hypothetical protein [Arthrospira platensis SPKY1]